MTSDPEYFDNWVAKFDMLCCTPAEIGFIGSSFFIGLLITIAWVPTASDKYGRVEIFRWSLLLQLGA